MLTEPNPQRLKEILAVESVAASAPHTPRGNRSLLMIDYYFPPIGGPGVRRTLGLVKHLAEYGWSPIVLTVNGGDFNAHDFALLQMVPDAVNVQRTASLEPIRFARRLLGRNADLPNNLDRRNRSTGFPWRGPRWMSHIAQSVSFPDRRIGWLPFAVARALALHRMHRFEVIYSTSGDVVTSHLIALVLKRILNRPWVADFQDPWVDTIFLSPGWRRTIAERIENRILQVADRVTFASEPVRAALQRKYGLPSEKLMTALLGFDPDAFDGTEPITRSKFTITHFGSFCCGRSPGSFLKALGQCIREHPSLAQDIEVLFFGSFDAEPLAETEALLDQFGMRDIVRLAGLVPYNLGVRHLVSSDILLLIAFPEGYGYDLIPTKLFDYLGARKPIMALLPDGAAAEIVRQTNAGAVIDPNDSGAIRNFILDRYHEWKQGALPLRLDHDAVRKCTVKEISRQFSTIFDEVLGVRP